MLISKCAILHAVKTSNNSSSTHIHNCFFELKHEYSINWFIQNKKYPLKKIKNFSTQ